MLTLLITGLLSILRLCLPTWVVRSAFPSFSYSAHSAVHFGVSPIGCYWVGIWVNVSVYGIIGL